MKIKDLCPLEIAGAEKRTRLALGAEELPMMQLAPTVPRTLTVPEWYKLTETEIRNGAEIALATAKYLRGVASKRAVYNILWKSNGLPEAALSEAMIVSAIAMGMGLFHVTLQTSLEIVVAGEGWVKRLGDSMAGGRALVPGRTLVAFEEDNCRFGRIITKFDVL
jgi:hypothetical protein